MFEYRNLRIDNLKANLQNVDDLKTISVGLSAQLGFPEKSSTAPCMVGFNYSASEKKGQEPFLVLDIRFFFTGSNPGPSENTEESFTRPLLKEALKHLKKQLEIISKALCINMLPCPEKFDSP